MSDRHQPLFSTAYLRSVWAKEYEEFKNSPDDANLLYRLIKWASKQRQKETSAESAFIEIFFKQTWDYRASGEDEKDLGYTLFRQYPIKRAGQKGGTGKADVALGYFGQKNMEEIPQVLCEFKDDYSGLDNPQINRPNDRSPVDQCLDYLREARTGLISTILPTWALVTDMNEFRLYLYGNKSQYQRFVIQPSKGDLAVSLLGDDEATAFQRFLFLRCFHSQSLLTIGGSSKLVRLLDEQITQEQTLENEFYLEYHSFREDGKTLTLTTMGRIFEQSITDLEVMEAHAEGRESLTELTKRKRDGVYYTPEWVTFYIVQETIGARLSEIRLEIGFDKFAGVTDKQITLYQTEARKPKTIVQYINALNLYSARMDDLKVVDPACGSGAFLIQAFNYLFRQRQWISNELERVTGSRGLFDSHSAMRDVLAKNLYGVDINSESVELTRLALWLHTALPDRPLTSLDQNILCGNSLIGNDFYRQMEINRDLFSEEERERVNTFDWEKAFPEVFQRENPGFDCVIGNPPYVKLQHFRKIQEDAARYLLEAKREDGGPLYESTRTGNFDLYLPFIERGIELLNPRGKMGYIAPNVWMVNEYGSGLRRKLKRTRRLDRWVDFKSFQVFDEAITYTALQFFSGCEHDNIRLIFAPGGKEEIAGIEWQEVNEAALYKDLPGLDSWVLIPNFERTLHTKLSSSCIRLDDACKGITVGIQTSADYIYHLERIGPNRYLHKPKDMKEPVEVEIEDAIMHPLVSGPEAKRYQTPDTSTYLLFPYELDNGKVRLLTVKDMESRYPKTWTYLKSYEKILREREKCKMDKDDSWWAYNYPKNLEKQEIAKLMVPRLVIHLFTTVDDNGTFYLDNVDVNGILVNNKIDLFFLAGILNAPVANFIWRRISKPFQNDYRSANKQFIAPLPIPVVTEAEKSEVAARAKKLQELHTRRRDLLLMIDKRLYSDQCEDDLRDESWIWSDIKPLAAIKKEAPSELTGRDLTAWAIIERERRLNVRLERITPMLHQGALLTVNNEYGELKALVNGMPLVSGIYLDENEATFIAAQWRQKIRQTNVTERFDGKRLLNMLLKLRKTNNPAIPGQVVRIDADLQTLDVEIPTAEAQMNALTYRLYKLTAEEISMVEKG